MVLLSVALRIPRRRRALPRAPTLRLRLSCSTALAKIFDWTRKVMRILRREAVGDSGRTAVGTRWCGYCICLWTRVLFPNCFTVCGSFERCSRRTARRSSPACWSRLHPHRPCGAFSSPLCSACARLRTTTQLRSRTWTPLSTANGVSKLLAHKLKTIAVFAFPSSDSLPFPARVQAQAPSQGAGAGTLGASTPS